MLPAAGRPRAVGNRAMPITAINPHQEGAREEITMNLKTIFALLAALTLTAGVVACNGDKDSAAAAE